MMKQIARRLVSSVLTVSMALSLVASPAWAKTASASAATAAAAEETSVSASTSFNANDYASIITNASIAAMSADAEGTEIDYDDPQMQAIQAELEDMVVTEEVEVVQNAAGTTGADGDGTGTGGDGSTTTTTETQQVALTEEQIQTAMGLYNQYLQQWEDNADVLGVQTPFYLSYNDSDDSLGTLGEMLVLAGYTVDDVRNGNYGYDDLIGMIVLFYYADKFGIQYFGDTIKELRDEALETVEDSGAKTEVQKLLVLATWLSQNATFDMAYIMNATGDDAFRAEDPVDDTTVTSPYNYQEMYNAYYSVYEDSISQQFHDGVYNAIIAQLTLEFYKNAIWNVVYQQAYAQYIEEHPEETEPVETTPVETTPAESTPAESTPTETTPAETTPAETTPAESTPAETTPTETTPAESTPAESTPAESTPAESDTVENEADTTRAALTEEENPEAAEYATQAADAFMEQNADAIEEDAAGFVEATFGEEAAAQLAEQCAAFIESAETDGVEVAEGVTMTVEELTQQTMDSDDPADGAVNLGTDEEPYYVSMNEAVKIYADAAASTMVTSTYGSWEGNQFATLGMGMGVCMGYTKAYAYLVQCMHPEIYTNGKGIDTASNWYTASELYYDNNGDLDLDSGYVVDMVRITYDADVTMFGADMEGFNSDHFWNAVKVDGEWYYIDTTYNDVWNEVMSRDTVESYGDSSHVYFMFSDATAREMYDGNYKEIATLYNSEEDDICNDTRYESSWVARIKSNVSSDGTYIYYAYQSFDIIKVLHTYNDLFGDDFNMSDTSSIDAGIDKLEEVASNNEYKIVRHAVSSKDLVAGTNDDGETVYGADTNFDTLIFFNYKEDEDDDTSVAMVYNPSTKKMEENELLTTLFAEFEEQSTIYPAVTITAYYYNGLIYFNISNDVLTYNVSTGEVAVVLEYNDVYAERDTSVVNGGMSFTVISEDEYDSGLSKDPADSNGNIHYLAVENPPISGITIQDGTLEVALATTYCWISGQTEHDVYTNDSDGNVVPVEGALNSDNYGYSYQESNYNPNYNSYFSGSDTNYAGMATIMGYDYSEETNDNDEFMYSAKFFDAVSLSALTGSGHTHSYEEVTVAPSCLRDGYTENRCSSCGAIEPDSRVYDEGTALEHHYIYFAETYYTKDDNDAFNTGFCYVCTECGYAVEEPDEVEEPTDPTDEDYEDDMKEYEAYLAAKAEYDAAVESAGHVYTLADPDALKVTYDENGDVSKLTYNGDLVCETCEGKLLDCLQDFEKSSEDVTLEDVQITIDNTPAISYTGDCTEGATKIFTFTDDVSGSTVGGTLTLAESVQLDPGQHGYAVVSDLNWHAATDENGNVICDENGQPVFTVDAPIEVECVICGDKQTIDEVPDGAITLDTTVPTCEVDGENVYTLYLAVKDDSGNTLGSITETHTEVLPAIGHDYGEAAFTWTEVKNEDDEITGYTATASRICANDESHVETVDAVVEVAASAATCTEGGITTYTATATFSDEAVASEDKTVEIAALGHSYGEPATFTWTEVKDKSGNVTGYSEATVTLTCANDETHHETVAATVTSVTTEATHSADGSVVYTATATYEGTEYSDVKEIILAMLENPFVDVTAGDNVWYYNAVMWALDEGVTAGTDDTHFSPTKTCTRAEMVQFLYNEAGKPAVPAGTVNPFVDVKEGAWYYDAVLWAVAEGITAGTDDTHFSPTKSCTRSEMVQFLYNQGGKPAVAAGTTNPFVDVKEGAWYYDAVLWAVAEGITAGTGNSTFSPAKTCTRAEMVQFLYNRATAE